MNPLAEDIEWATGLNAATLLNQLAAHGLTIVRAKRVDEVVRTVYTGHGINHGTMPADVRRAL